MRLITRVKIALVLATAVSLCAVRSASTAGKNAEPAQEGVEFFEKKIRPVLEANCVMCHGSQSAQPQGGLVLDTRAGMLRGGNSGSPAIVAGDPEKSLLIQAIRYTDSKLQMPPTGQLTIEQIKDFEAWVKMGAPDPRKDSTSAGAKSPPQPYDFDEARKFWSFQPVKDPTLPTVKNEAWVKSPVDRFILARLEEKNLRPAPGADKRTLLRRATFDLTGLPPAPDEVEAFLRDQAPDAFAKVVDRLLSSPHYGERWGRHWLDVVRYADTSGCNSDFPVPSAYKYRNYVIKSFNDDQPYDQFIREQIAGDLLPSATEAERHERIAATGYLAISRRFGSRNNEFYLTIDDTIDNVGKAVIGLSVSCARCHDHKFDPIPTKDYYALYGIFKSTRYAFPGTEIYRHTKDFVPLANAHEAKKLIEWQTELAQLDDRLENLNVEKAALLRKAKAASTGVVAEAPAKNESADAKARTLDAVKAELTEVKERIAELESKVPIVEKAYAVSEGDVGDAKIYRKGDPKNPGEVAPRGFLQILGGEKLPEKHRGSGRLELAQWLTDPHSPLLGRVMVNRIWQHHFGKGIVQTPNDFGVRGKAPTHPELLDYLAARFRESNWSIKAMHRMIMLSRAYQMSGRDDAHSAAIDVGNDLLWKFDRRRLSAEEIRDAMLAIGGALDPTMGGEHPFPPENQWRYTQHKPFVTIYESDRRSVYLMQPRIKKLPFLEIFDGADTNAATAERPLSTTPLQALFMMNDAFAHKQADNLAVRVGMAHADDARRLNYAYQLALGRPATAAEIREGVMYLKQSMIDLKEAELSQEKRGRAALASYLRVVLSSNEFLFVD